MRKQYTDDMNRLDGIRELLAEHQDVQLGYVFGSVANGNERESSDIDLAVLLAPAAEPATFERLAADLETLSGRPVDLVDLGGAPPILAREIVFNGQLLFCRDEEQRIFFESRTIARYLDTAHLRRVQYGYLKERAEAYRAVSS
jgi:predicted nucleotidyltransferase